MQAAVSHAAARYHYAVMRTLVTTLLLVCAATVAANEIPDLFSDPGVDWPVADQWPAPDGPPMLARRTSTIDLDQLAQVRQRVNDSGDARIRLNLFDGVEFDATVERTTPTSRGYALSGQLRGPASSSFTLVVNGNVVAGDVANYRDSTTRCDYRLTPDTVTVPTSGGSFSVVLETTDGCAWSARSFDPILTVESGAEGDGNGEVVYRVAPNEGWHRTVALRIAGETFLVHQETDPVPTAVCERSGAVKDAITEALGKSCENIGAGDLNSLARLVIQSVPAPVAGDFDGMTNLGELHVKWTEETKLPPSIFDGLANVVELVLTGAGLESGVLDDLQNLDVLHLNGGDGLPGGLFAGLSSLEELRLNDFDLASLPVDSFHGLTNVTTLSITKSRIGPIERGAFNGLGALDTLIVAYGEIGSLEHGAFEGLSSLGTLGLYFNKLTGLVPGIFDGLSKVDRVDLQNNELTELVPGTFSGLTSIEYLYLQSNRLTRLEPGVFSELTTLRWRLELGDNELESLEPGVFDGLPNLYALMLGGNRLADVPAGALDGLTSLILLDLHGNRLPELPAGLFKGLPELSAILLHENGIGRFPAGIFEGLPLLTSVTLRANPGAPFPLALELVRLPRTGSGADSVALHVAEGSPYAMSVGLSIEDGTAEEAKASILAGQTVGEGVSIAPAGHGAVTATLSNVPADPTAKGCELTNQHSYFRLEPCYPGIELIQGSPIQLYGMRDQTIRDDAPATFDLADIFGVFFDTDEVSYTASSSDSGIVAILLRDGILTLTPHESGTATITVVATDGESSITREFEVTIPEGLRSLWRGWRLRLLTEES